MVRFRVCRVASDGVGGDDGCGNRGDAHGGGAELGFVLEDQDEGFGEVEGAARDDVADLQAGEAVVAYMHAHG